MAEIVDEVSVLRDAYWLGQQNLDLCPEGSDLPIARELESRGLLSISVVGRTLRKPCYRLTPAATDLARSCYDLVEQQRAEIRGKVADQLEFAGLPAAAAAIRAGRPVAEALVSRGR